MSGPGEPPEAEAVARLIDPEAFDLLDDLRDNPPRDRGEGEFMERGDDDPRLFGSEFARADDALTKARAILALPFVAERAEQIEALEPFAAEAKRWPAGLKDTHEPFPISPLTLGDFRRAARAITPEEKGK